MNHIKFAGFILLITTLVSPAVMAGPTYASDESRKVIEAMVEAHGGIERWRAAPAISFTDVMHDEYHELGGWAWWAAREVVDQKTRQVYQDWPFIDARLGYDGTDVWTTGWKRGNPPAMMVHFFYYFVNLPWITQDDGVLLSEPAEFNWPGIDEPLTEVKMTFENRPGPGKSVNGYFVLYIHPETNRLVGYQYTGGYRPFLDAFGFPPERELFGPLWRLITAYEEVGGLLFPTAFHTMPEAGERIVGDHLILNIDISTPFDADKSQVPEGGVIDAAWAEIAKEEK
jgi:hypothetical protein